MGVSVGGVCDVIMPCSNVVSFGSAALTIGHLDTISNMDPDENGCVGGRCL